jgi:hypothetical protein
LVKVNPAGIEVILEQRPNVKIIYVVISPGRIQYPVPGIPLIPGISPVFHLKRAV